METVCAMPGFTGLHGGLIESTGLNTMKEVVYSKHFQHPSFTLSLRPFCIPHDMTIIYSWARKLCRAADIMEASYRYVEDSDFARSFMVLRNNRTAVCQVDICAADKDILCDAYAGFCGDYIIRLLMNINKKTARPLHLKALQTCMEYFFLFPEIRQIIAEPEADNTAFNEMLLKAGFKFKDQVCNQYALYNLFVCTRQSFIPA
jgi:RimJ/RimL family protein N-acetyltransferase